MLADATISVLISFFISSVLNMLRASSILSTAICCLLAIELAGYVGAAHNPRPAHHQHNPLKARQVKAGELVARQKYPELFEKRHYQSVVPAPKNPCSLRRRSDLEPTTQVLNAEEMAAFLKGRGTFVA